MDVKLTVLLGGKKGTVLELRGPETIIGRAGDAQVRIPSASVSRQHCRLTLEDGYVVAEDLHSSNGTFINGTRITKQPVRPDDRLQVGPVVFAVDYELSETTEHRLLSETSTAYELVTDEPTDNSAEMAAGDMTLRRNPNQGTEDSGR